jgi:hypothetical protein
MSTFTPHRALFLCLALCQCTGNIQGEQTSDGVPGPPGDPDNPPGDTPITVAGFQAQPGALRKLTVAQYRNSIHDVLGPEIVVPEDLEADTSVNGYTQIAAAQGSVSATAAEKFENAAYDIAAQAMVEPVRSRLVTCVPAAATDDTCARTALTALSTRAFRRPPTETEVVRFVTLANAASVALGDFYLGMEFGIAGILQSVPFLYRVEIGEPDPANANAYRYNASELATRLSFLIWNTTPDSDLLTKVADGTLLNASELTAQAARLLSSPRAKEGVATFHYERFGLSHLSNLSKDPATYPQLTDTLITAMQQEVQEMVADIVANKRDYRELLTGRSTFVNQELGALYGLSATGTTFTKATFPEDSPRSGFLTSAAFLSVHAGNVESSPSKRGKAVREAILCQAVEPPPPGVVTVIPPQPSKTMREKLAAHATQPTCAGCHAAIDPIGLAFEHFDAIGAYRETDDGVTLDVTGNLEGTAFADARGLTELIASMPEAASCTVKSLYRYALGHVERPGEEPVITDLTTAFTAGGYKFDALVAALAESPAIRVAAKPEE